MSTQSNTRIGKLDIDWNLERGELLIFGLDSVMFWTNPSLYRLLAPLVEELGVELFRLLVAHSSSIGTETDYEVMVTKLARAFALYMRACDGGDMAGCFSAGVCHRTGACAEKNEAVANTLIKRACDGGDTRACANVSGR